METRRKKQMPKKAADHQMADIEGLFEDAYTAYEERRRDREYENAAFYRGQHYIDAGIGGQTQLMEDEAMETQNLVRSIINAAVASRLRQMPQIAIASLRGDVKARARAKASEGFCQAALHNGIIDWDEHERVSNWCETCGLGWIKVYWDPKAGRKIKRDAEDFWDEADRASEPNDDEVDVTEYDPFGEPVEEAQYEGDIRTMFVPSSDGLPNADARSWKEVRHFFHVRLMPVGQILDMWPKDMWGKELGSADFDTGANAYGGFQAQMRMVQQDDEGIGTSTHEMDNELAQLVVFWELPTRK
jgi:hypothetical protein